MILFFNCQEVEISLKFHTYIGIILTYLLFLFLF